MGNLKKSKIIVKKEQVEKENSLNEIEKCPKKDKECQNCEITDCPEETT